MIKNDICNFNKQFEYEPEIHNCGDFKIEFEDKRKFVVAGMGGSGFPSEILKAVRPDLDIVSSHDYGLPPISDENYDKCVVIAISYSGNTEETISAFERAREDRIPVAAIAAGGRLIELARDAEVPYIQIPSTNIQPRMATGYLVNALLKFIDEVSLEDPHKLSGILDPSEFESRGKELAKKLRGKVPVIYCSNRNFPLSRVWKIKFNETTKIPAFSNVFPELNHNEMTGFDTVALTKALSENLYFIILKDSDDDPKITKRMSVLEKLYRDRGLETETIELGGRNRMHKIFSSLVLADWTAYYLSQYYGTEPEAVPMVEEFKRLIRND